MTFSEIITKYRKDLNLTQEGLASQLGVTNQAVSKWESGQSCPDIALLPKLADVFGITIDQLFGRETKKEEPRAELPWADDGILRVVLYTGHTHVGHSHPKAQEISFCYEGPALNISSELSIRCGDVMGSVAAGGSVNCDDVYGNIITQGNVTCDDVKGDIQAMGNVTCDCAEGDIRAGGNVNVDEASGDIRAGGDVNCDHWER